MLWGYSHFNHLSADRGYQKREPQNSSRFSIIDFSGVADWSDSENNNVIEEKQVDVHDNNINNINNHNNNNSIDIYNNSNNNTNIHNNNNSAKPREKTYDIVEKLIIYPNGKAQPRQRCMSDNRPRPLTSILKNSPNPRSKFRTSDCARKTKSETDASTTILGVPTTTFGDLTTTQALDYSSDSDTSDIEGGDCSGLSESVGTCRKKTVSFSDAPTVYKIVKYSKKDADKRLKENRERYKEEFKAKHSREAANQKNNKDSNNNNNDNNSNSYNYKKRGKSSDSSTGFRRALSESCLLLSPILILRQKLRRSSGTQDVWKASVRAGEEDEDEEEDDDNVFK